MDRDRPPTGVRPAPRRGAWHYSLALVIGGSILAGCSSSSDPSGPGAAANVLAASTTSQQGLIGQPVTSRPSVRVTDAQGVSVPGIQVTFNVGAGGGSLTGGTQTTNSNGIATVGSWTLGAVAGPNTMTATAAGLNGSPVTFNATGGTTVTNFDILITYLTGAPGATALAAFQAAEQRWERVITGDVPDFSFNTNPVAAGTCDPLQPARTSGVLDDLEIFVVLDSIDGPFGILGQAGPCFSRNPNGYTILGVMIFDTADVARLQIQGRLNATILHEMGHVLGFGTHWEPPFFNLLTGAGTGNPQFTGANAVAAFTTLNNGTGTTVPVDNSGVPGTADSHWDEPGFGSELMTGTLSGTSQPMSATTIRSMQDLAYQVNVGEADPFDFTNPGAVRETQAAPAERLVDDILRRPRYIVGPNGLVPVPWRR
jgi:hypothetical protein